MNEHTDTRTALCNGHRDKTLTTQAGDLDLAMPRFRSGGFFPSLLERRLGIGEAFFAVIMEACVHGLSTRSVDDPVKVLGAGSGISRSDGYAPAWTPSWPPSAADPWTTSVWILERRRRVEQALEPVDHFPGRNPRPLCHV
ncbi:transposase [Streptomyces erythrochromogenes]|uniref:transposase n=1 Tax=Streptomyces erythrochromogenes TaxID=285574 RepID=UPI0036C92DF4